VPESGQLLEEFKAAIAESILEVLPSTPSTSNEVNVTSVNGVSVRRSLRVLQDTSQNVGFRVRVTNNCRQQDCANQDATNADTKADLVVAAYSNAITVSITAGNLIKAIRDKGVTLSESSTAVLESAVRGPVSVEILELPSASPSPEPSLIPSAVPSTVPSSSPSMKNEQKLEQKEVKAEQKDVKKEAKTEQKDVKKEAKTEQKDVKKDGK
jgi:hypothetical protein